MFEKKFIELKRALEKAKRENLMLLLPGGVEKEQWKPVTEPGFESTYEVSDLGRVRSKDRWIKVAGHMTFRRGKVLRPCVNRNNGYYYVVLSHPGVQTEFTVHSLVAKAWVPRKKGLNFINHINENKLDNRASNLEWCTASYNIRYRGLSKRQAETRYKHGFTKRVRVRDTRTQEVKHFKSLNSAARALKSSPRTLRKYAKLEKPIRQGFYIDLEN
ncbi:NUMOD4 domain-containing protein [Lactobacillus crispatus]|uniref:NUMOD4 domain-containing protein n=1 Tax=Lactobacillus crispatus TaxID=47770 RepID=UPI00130303F4|nr:NUMOD4 domain-containing protein [Lactobacillus crispatus]